MSAQTSTSTASLAWVTWLRIIAIYGVVAIHSAGATASSARSMTSVDGWVARALDLPFIWAVPVFVMISGALSLDPAKFRGSGPYLRKRVWRLLPALVVWHLVYLTYMAQTREGWLDGWRDGLAKVVQGQVAPHLYFLWIVLGLSVLTPVLVPWIGRAGRREWVAGAVIAYAVPILSTWPLGTDGARIGVTHSAWTWWLPYLGAYLMGWALRGVVLPRRWVWPTLLVVISLMTLLTWQWKNPAAAWLESWSGAHYYSPTVAVLSVLIILLAQTMIRPGGALDVLTSASVLRYAEPVALATMGIFTLHFLVLIVGTDTGLLGPPVTSWPLLLVRIVVVSLVTTLLVLPLRKVPWVRAVL
ncbi:MAG: acyltransferase [Ornithinimicrobium sp.]|uniref:acyltransferase n=1 Tax=Ornithinimicrobium sp. TaxID=1977084 RepID=UPI0026DF3851|nr:acyltransferase [Ornithinimicrobium sp.]MDO5738545.1 acyltransferase [Ornithinimicrobium sp.]